MRYLTIEDIKVLIKDTLLDEVSEGNYALLDNIEESTLDLIDSYIRTIYDTEYEYLLTTTNRNSFLVRIAVDIFVYDFYTRLSVDLMSDLREQRYNMALDLLKKIAKGEITPDIKERDTELDLEYSATSLFGSNVKVNTQW